jgi:type IV pilus assembly protein PilO
MALTDQLDIKPVLEKMERLPASQKYVVLALAFVAVVGIYWFSLYGGMRTEHQALRSELTQLQAKIAETRSVVSNLKSFEESRGRLRKQLNEALRRLPNAKELPVLLTDITSLGKKSGLEFRSFRPQGEVDRGFYSEVPIQIELSGRFHDLGVFFDRVARLSRIVNVSELNLVVADYSGDTPTLKVRGVATTFRFNEAPQTAGGE